MREENLKRLTYFKTNVFDPLYLHFKPLFRDVNAAIEKYAKGAVLDMGCGNKPYEPLFTNVTEYLGCDVIQSSEHKVDILCLCTDVPLEDNRFDTIFCTQVLEHVEDHFKLLQEAFRLLKPGGYIILSAPFCWQHHEVPYDFFRFSHYGLEYLFNKAGFETEYIKPNGGKWALMGQMLQNTLSSSLKGRKGILRKTGYLFYRFFLKYMINIVYQWLERIDYDDKFLTLNFVVVAKKPL